MSEITVVLLYIDPGIIYLTLQILAGSLLGVAFYFHRTTTRILRNVRLIFRRKDGDETKNPGG